MLEVYTEQTVLDSVIEKELRTGQEEYRKTVSKSLRTCCSGNKGAKETVKVIIREHLLHTMGISEGMVEQMIHFHHPEQMTGWYQLETLLYVLGKEQEDMGFSEICDRFLWGQNETVISREKMLEAYEQINPVLSWSDKVSILTQLIYSVVAGLGVIDTLNQQKGSIEEIQLGLNGRIEQCYDYREELSGKRKTEIFSKDGVHVLLQGRTVWLQFLSFGSEAELQRVLRNLIKDSLAGELTKNNPMVVVDTLDGRRISVSRPPLTDSWIGLVRKFDTVQEVSLKQLYEERPEKNILPELIRQLVKSGRNIAITGEMASGKTTLFRACLAEVREDRNIRVIEADSFEMNVRSFLPRANSMTMRVSDRTPAAEVLAFARKTTGQIFAVGEINSAAVAAMAMDLAKIASQMFFSAHYVSTEDMIMDFVNAKLCVGGYSEEKLAEADVIRCMGFDIHLKSREGKRYVQYIHEIIPKKGGYEIKEIYRFHEETQTGSLTALPDKITFDRAMQELPAAEYEEFLCFFRKGCEKKA